MNLVQQLAQTDRTVLGRELHQFAAKLYPICRSITGNGIRQSLRMIQERIPIEILEVPSGTQVFDWTVPKEWNIKDAFIRDSTGRCIVDFKNCNLHVVNYSTPIRAKLPLSELKKRIHSIPSHPDWIPYRTSYYKEDWGFCLSQNQLEKMHDANYEVCIDSTLADGSLSYGEYFLKGKSEQEILISCHACHPSLANDNLSGIAVATHLAQMLSNKNLRYSYRFLFIPGTIGAIAWLSRNREAASRVRGGLVLACLGDRSAFHYKKSRQGDSEIDRAAAHVLGQAATASEILPFSPTGYDERQYCSAGFNLAVGCLTRGVWGTFPEYHTSADNLEFVVPDSLAESFAICVEILTVLEENAYYRNLFPFCEPQLGKRGLYHSVGGRPPDQVINARLWVLNLSDGQNSLLDIAERSGLPFGSVREAAELLKQNGLLAPSEKHSGTIAS
jgi:aminopeptidase-like protein